MALTIHLNVNQHINYEENELPQLTENSRGLFWQSAQHVCISLCLTLQALLFVLSVKRFLRNERSIVQEKKKFSKLYVKLMSGDSSPLFCIFALGKEFHIKQSLTLFFSSSKLDSAKLGWNSPSVTLEICRKSMFIVHLSRNFMPAHEEKLEKF